MVIDQRAAQERVVFQELRAHYATSSAGWRQSLLFPIPVEVDPALVTQLSDQKLMAVISAMGFRLEVFSPETLLLREVPVPLKNADPKPLILDLLGAVLAEGFDPEDKTALNAAFSSLACHLFTSSPPPLTGEGVRTLLTQLDGVDFRLECPQGRPVLFRLSKRELERSFARR